MRRRVEGGVFLSLFSWFFFLGAFHPHSCICLFFIGISLSASASLCILLHHHCFFPLSSFVIDPLLLWSSDKHIIFHVFRRHRHHSCSVVLFVLLLFCTITCFATITYYFSLHTIMSHGIMTHYYTVEISMDICCLSGKSICTSSLNFFIANPFGDFGDRPFPTKSRAA